MKYTLILLLLSSTFAISSPIPAHMLEKSPSQLNLIFSKTKVLQREIRTNRGSREARDCRFCPRAMPEIREIRMSRLSRKGIFQS
ncbi:MAG: hypothetical protein KAG56_00145 [Sulfurovaceae bacterium]|nr:hypothetical protein [Sulfurovaceae bacterium]